MAINTVSQRAQLAPRREPHWHPIATGQHLGYRKTEDGGHWIAKYRDPATGERTYQALGTFDSLPANERFDAASEAAREWFANRASGGTSEVVTVAQACAAYVEWARRENGPASASDAAARFRRYVDHDPIARIPLLKLRRHHVEEWRQRLEKEPAKAPKRGSKARTKKPEPAPRKRSAATTNRDMVALRAALNLARKRDAVPSDRAWSEALAPAKGAGKRRNVYLERDQRRALIAALPDDAAAFVRGLCLLPLRPGALAALTVGDFDSRSGSLTIHRDKASEGRSILLPQNVVALMREQARRKTPAAPLFSRGDGSAWHKDAWKKPIATAVAQCDLPAGTTAYTMRHAGITDLVAGGLDLFHVAALSGTSVAMIEKHYGHLRREHARDALAGLAL